MTILLQTQNEICLFRISDMLYEPNNLMKQKFTKGKETTEVRTKYILVFLSL